MTTQAIGTLSLTCKRLRIAPGVHFAGQPKRAGLEAFELVQPDNGTSTLVDRWANGSLADRNARHIEIHDEEGTHRFDARRIDKIIRLTAGNVSFGAYPDSPATEDI